MKIHEYQARQLFAEYGIPVPKGQVAMTPQEVFEIATRFGRPVMVKAQVHVGGRGKAGGIKFAATPADARERATQILGMDIKGLTVKKVLVSEAADIGSEAYAGIIVDRASKKPILMVSAAGGIDIEQVARETPEKIVKIQIDPQTGLLPYQARQAAFVLYSDINLVRQASKILVQLYECFMSEDCSLAEINPLITTPTGEVWAIDAKINLDDSALFRHPDSEAMRDVEEADLSEDEARRAGLSFVKLNGNIGCVVNGAGLAMATMDMVKYYGGEPANFLDIGGSSNPEKVVTAMRIILRDSNVRAILFNIFGGITRGDDVARGIVTAVKQMKPSVPIVIRITGTNEELARRILEEVGLAAATSMSEAVQRAIGLAQAGTMSFDLRVA
jgi:succinyl-CoA synthetase beta subunit